MTSCEHEPRIVLAARGGRPFAEGGLPPELEAHVASCAQCREVADTVRWMTTLAAETARLADRRRLPEAGQLWWKGQLARRWEAEARAVAPLDAMQRIEVAAGIVAAAVLLATFFLTLGPETADAGRGELFPALAGLLSNPGLPWIMVGVLGAVTGVTLMLRRLLASE
jgi:hypothetical protein